MRSKTWLWLAGGFGAFAVAAWGGLVALRAVTDEATRKANVGLEGWAFAAVVVFAAGGLLCLVMGGLSAIREKPVPGELVLTAKEAATGFTGRMTTRYEGGNK